MPQPLNIHLYLLTNLHFRGKDMLSYEDDEISDVGGYDLVHYDDLSYVASAHQERKSTHMKVAKLCCAVFHWCILFYLSSAQNGCQRHDSLQASHQRFEVAMASNVVKTRVQELKARLHHLDASSSNVSLG